MQITDIQKFKHSKYRNTDIEITKMQIKDLQKYNYQKHINQKFLIKKLQMNKRYLKVHCMQKVPKGPKLANGK